MALKLFMWDKMESLRNYARGEAFALACSRFEAIELIIEEVEKADEDGFGFWTDKDELTGRSRLDEVRQELQSKEPRVITTQCGFFRMGSD